MSLVTKMPRNAPCFCGSKIKFKNCCEPLDNQVQAHLKQFDNIVHSKLKEVVDRVGPALKKQPLKIRPYDYTEKVKIYYVKGVMDLISVEFPTVRTIKTREDLESMLKLSFNELKIFDYTEVLYPKKKSIFEKPDIEVIEKAEIIIP